MNSAVEYIENPQIPVVDFGPYLSGDAAGGKKVVEEVLKALKGYGVMALVNHGISEEEVSRLHEQSHKFFAIPQEAKEQYKHTCDGAVGYVAPGQELFDYGQKDLKESMSIGKEGRPDEPNLWPSEVPTFKSTLLEMFTKFDQLHLEILGCIEEAFEVQKGSITSKCNEQHQFLRLLHYPSVDSKEVSEEDRGVKRCGDHTDYGTITLLLQDMVGGLQIKLRDGRWVDVVPVKNAVVIQVADMLQRWTNGILPAARHRVISPTTTRGVDQVLADRYSVAFFCLPNRDATISALPTTYDDDKHPRLYKPFNAMEYLTLRLRASI